MFLNKKDIICSGSNFQLQVKTKTSIYQFRLRLSSFSSISLLVSNPEISVLEPPLRYIPFNCFSPYLGFEPTKALFNDFDNFSALTSYLYFIPMQCFCLSLFVSYL